MFDLFQILATPLGIAMNWLYGLIQNYGLTIIVFTFVIRVLMFPLNLKQQKSTAKMAAYNPMIMDIRKKWANDKNRQNAEIQKFYEENNVKMSAGCLPMAVNMLVLFGIIAVIQSPLNYILSVPEAEIDNGVAIVQQYAPESDIGYSDSVNTRQAELIAEIRENPQIFITGAEVPVVDGATYILDEGESFQNNQIVDEDGKVEHEQAEMKFVSMSEASIEKVTAFNFDFLGLNLSLAPKLEFNSYLIMPILSVILQILSQVIIMKASPNMQQTAGTMWMMTIVLTLMFGFYAFSVPVGFSLYYSTSSVTMTLQQLILRKVYNPDKIREQVIADIEERKAAKKAKKQVAIINENGDTETKNVSEAELNKLRLQKAREQDELKYGLDSSQKDNSSDKSKEKEEAKEEAKE